MTTKYKIKLNDLERSGGVERLTRDGFKRVDITRAIHKEMQGAHRYEKDKVVERLYNRREVD